MMTRCPGLLSFADWSLLFPFPIGVPPKAIGCDSRAHSAVLWTVARVRLMLRDLYESGVSVSTKAYMAGLSQPRLVQLLLGETTRSSDLPESWHDTFNAPGSDLARDSGRDSPSSVGVEFYFNGSVHEWGATIGWSESAAWRARRRWVAAAIIIAEIQWVFQFPCVCDAIRWWGMNRQKSLRTPGRYNYDARLSAVSAVIPFEDEFEIVEEMVHSRVLEDPAAYVQYYLHRGDGERERCGPSLTQRAASLCNPALDVWTSLRQSLHARGCAPMRYPAVRHSEYDYTAWQKPATSRLMQPQAGVPLDVDWRVALATGYEPPADLRSEVVRLARARPRVQIPQDRCARQSRS